MESDANLNFCVPENRRDEVAARAHHLFINTPLGQKKALDQTDTPSRHCVRACVRKAEIEYWNENDGDCTGFDTIPGAIFKNDTRESILQAVIHTRYGRQLSRLDAAFFDTFASHYNQKRNAFYNAADTELALRMKVIMGSTY